MVYRLAMHRFFTLVGATVCLLSVCIAVAHAQDDFGGSIVGDFGGSIVDSTNGFSPDDFGGTIASDDFGGSITAPALDDTLPASFAYTEEDEYLDTFTESYEIINEEEVVAERDYIPYDVLDTALIPAYRDDYAFDACCESFAPIPVFFDPVSVPVPHYVVRSQPTFMRTPSPDAEVRDAPRQRATLPAQRPIQFVAVQSAGVVLTIVHGVP